MSKKQEVPPGQALAWKAFIDVLNKLHDEKGLSHDEIARRVGTKRNVVWEWVKTGKGGIRVPFETMCKRLRAVGLNPADFYDMGTDEFIEIPWVEATASMGSGSLLDGKSFDSHLSFRANWLLRRGTPARMAVINASGGSMEPTIPNDSVVLIDESKKHDLVNGKIYFVCYGESLYLKRLKIQKGRVVSLESDRGDDPIEIKEGVYFDVIGQALWFGKDL